MLLRMQQEHLKRQRSPEAGQMKRLHREKKNLRAIALKKTSLKKKRKIFQKGGFIGAILPPILTVLSSLLGGLVGGNGAR